MISRRFAQVEEGMALLSEDVAKLEADHLMLVSFIAQAMKQHPGRTVEVFHGREGFSVGAQTDVGAYIVDAPLTRDLANEIVCAVNGIAISGRR